MTEPAPSVLVDCTCDTGEGPLWHPDEGQLYWVDIPAGKLFRCRPETGSTETFEFDRPIGGMTLQADGALLLFMSEGRVARWQSGQMDIVVDSLEAEHGNRFNDVIADPEGRVFCGVMSTPERAGRLYRLDCDGSIHVMLEGTGTANGMGFSPDHGKMYFCDSRKVKTYVFDYERATGDLSNQRILVDPPEGEGRPDGMTVDADGNIWSARWDGARVVKISPEGETLETIHFPARNVSCITFGGPDYTDMFITTARGSDPDNAGEHAGALFHMNMGIRGVPEFRSRVAVPAKA